MLTLYRSEDRHHADHGWLKSNFSFSFADYYDPENVQFGPMRVLNDDWVAPMEGFGTHPHREMEIVTIVLEGILEHKDSLGNQESTRWGGIQRMSAGTGIFHSEYNISSDEPLVLLQMWFTPSARGLKPSYETSNFDTASLKGEWVPVVSPEGVAGKIASINQDMTIYLSELADGKPLHFKQAVGRKMLLMLLDGEATVNGETKLGQRDSLRIEFDDELTVVGSEGSRLMLIDLP
jgi:quercetin 2,3-dioxygenase